MLNYLISPAWRWALQVFFSLLGVTILRGLYAKFHARIVGAGKQQIETSERFIAITPSVTRPTGGYQWWWIRSQFLKFDKNPTNSPLAKSSEGVRWGPRDEVKESSQVTLLITPISTRYFFDRMVLSRLLNHCRPDIYHFRFSHVRDQPISSFSWQTVTPYSKVYDRIVFPSRKWWMTMKSPYWIRSMKRNSRLVR